MKVERLEHLGEGNIESSNALLPPVKVKKQGNQKLKYDFVWNNYKSEDLERLERFLKGLTKRFVFQEEIGKNGTPHLQGAIWLKKRARMSELVKNEELKHCSFRELKSTWLHLSTYCQKTINEKEGGRLPKGKVFRHNVKKIRKPIKVLEYDALFDWEKEIISLIDEEPDDRSINWYWEPIGGVGKSIFCKYLAAKHNAIVLGGKAADMKYGIVKYIEKHGDYPETIVIDVPRTSQNFLSYGGIEQIKNGMFFSTKYESDMVLGNCPHLIVFANFEPDLDKMSKDRWKIKYIGKKKLQGLSSSDDDLEY